jgi:two-component system, NarL family, response regulator LiaR
MKWNRVNMVEKKEIKVLIVDDHPVVRDGLKSMLLAFDDLELVGEAQNGQAALDFCHEQIPDVILMDILMPGMDGIQATRAILEQFPQVRIIILSSYTENDLVQETLEAGAVSYILKNTAIDVLADAIRSAVSGQSTLSPEATRSLIQSKKDLKLGSDLSERELEVLSLLVEGLSNHQIALRLDISPATARHHVSACIQKLGAANRTKAAALALQHHLVIPSN